MALGLDTAMQQLPIHLGLRVGGRISQIGQLLSELLFLLLGGYRVSWRIYREAVA